MTQADPEALRPGQPVPFPGLSALLYGMLAALMLVGIWLASHGILRTVERAQAEVTLMAAIQDWWPAMTEGLAGDETAQADLQASLAAHLIETAPDQDAAEAALDEARASDRHPRSVARVVQPHITGDAMGDAVAVAWLYLALRQDLPTAAEGLINGLGLVVRRPLERRQVSRAVDALQADATDRSEEDQAALDQVMALAEAESATGIWISAAITIAILLGLIAFALIHCRRFAADALRLLHRGVLVPGEAAPPSLEA